jgi:phenylalanyl-tRNA synthetase alpha chain
MKPEILERLNQVSKTALDAIDNAKNVKELIEVKNVYLSKKSDINSLMIIMKELNNDEKKEFGKLVNEIKKNVDESYTSKFNQFSKQELNDKLNKESIDITLPGINENAGHLNPFLLIQDEIVDIFLNMGYEVKEGRDVEQDHYNFELMNIPKNHPSRDMQDSFYINESTLLRTHTSPAQARAMEEAKGAPIRIICPGKCYRRDDDDMTHSHQFGQIEGLVVDKGINIANLKATLELFIKKMFGEKREIRLRSSYFPFTEPSVEVDVTCAECGGKGCSMCKGSGYIEILGAGMVHPNVLRMNGYDPDIYSGFAFGIGIERVAMLRYGIDDIRRFYQNDMRFISQFERK